MAGLGEIAGGIGSALAPLRGAVADERALTLFLAEFGWQVDAAPEQMAAIRAGFAVGPALDAIAALSEQLDEPTQTSDAASAAALAQAVVALLRALKQLASAPPGGALPAPLNSAAFWQEFAPALADSLLLRWLEREQPFVYALLRLTGLADVTAESPAARGRLPWRRYAIRWDRLPRVIGEPDRLIREVWGWGNGQPFDHLRLDDVLGDTLRALHVPARRAPLTAPLRGRWWSAANPVLPELKTLAVPLVIVVSGDRSVYGELGIALTPIPPRGQPGAPPAGFALTPLAEGSIGAGGPLGDDEEPSVVHLHVRGGFDLDGALGAEIRPGGVELFADAGDVALDAEVRLAATPPRPFVLIGTPGSFRLEAGGAEAGVGVSGRLADPELLVRLGTGTPRQGVATPKLAVVIETSEADGFLGRLIGSTPLRLELGGAVVWSSKSGLHFEGSGGFEWTIPLNLGLGPAEISTLTLALTAGSGGVEIGAGVTGRALLGPLTAVVEQFGLAVRLAFGDARGDLGPVAVSLGFKPPKGIGLAIDAGVVKGGGYLFFDQPRGEYAGALELTFAGWLSLKAIGLLNTRMPDGSSGFSLLVIITAEFGSGLQLGYGFTLIGVGGLLGLNRTMRLQPLMEGVRTGAINSVMFPRDVVANAPKIISDLRTLFPPRNGTFLIGPMAKLGWGTPTLISLALGIVVEIPGNVAIIGVLRIALPADQAAVVVLQVNFAGAIEFDKKRVYFFAALFDSRVLFLTIEGEIAVVAQFGDDAAFVLSVGGFHPRFDPPPLPVPVPRRIAVNIVNTDVARVRVEGYFAVTSNTVQFGARAELFFGFSAFNVSGHIGFDALFQFSPFHFVIEVSASFSVKVFGIGLFSVSVRMSLEGPTPWRARGTGSISILFFDIDVDFDITWGEQRDTQLAPVDVLPLLSAELAKAENWKALPPAPSNLLVSLRRLDPARAAADTLVLHPLGALQVTQRAVPLDLQIDKVGNRRAADAKRFTLAPAAGRGLAKRGDVNERFAPAQYREMGDAEKLGKPAFELEHGGIELTPSGQEIASGALVKRVNRYELSTLDTAYRRRRLRFHAFPLTLFVHFLGGCAVARSPLSQAVRDQHDPFAPADKVTVAQEGWAVAALADNSALATFASEAQARDHLAERLAAEPNASLHVIPAFEVAA